MDREAWNRRYGGDELLWRAEPNMFLPPEVEGLVPGRALDLACGEGRNAVWLAAQGWTVTGVDFSSTALAKARRLAADHRVEVEWTEADVTEWAPPAGAFDLVVIFYLHLPAAERRLVHQRAAAALAPGSTLLVVGHDVLNLTAGYGGPRDAAVLYTPEDVVTDLAEVAGLAIVRAERVTRPVGTDAGEIEAIDALVRASRPA